LLRFQGMAAHSQAARPGKYAPIAPWMPAIAFSGAIKKSVLQTLVYDI
jgi:hypothetical protein